MDLFCSLGVNINLKPTIFTTEIFIDNIKQIKPLVIILFDIQICYRTRYYFLSMYDLY